MVFLVFSFEFVIVFGVWFVILFFGFSFGFDGVFMCLRVCGSFRYLVRDSVWCLVCEVFLLFSRSFFMKFF